MPSRIDRAHATFVASLNASGYTLDLPTDPVWHALRDVLADDDANDSKGALIRELRERIARLEGVAGEQDRNARIPGGRMGT